MTKDRFALQNYAALKAQFELRLADTSLHETRRRLRSMFCPSASYGRHFGPPSADAKQAAVMILVEPRGNSWSIPLTMRPRHLPDHPGQISFPGGRLENTETHRQAAVREFEEELGVEPFPGEIIGELQPLFVYNSNYYVRPYLAICKRQLTYVPCTREVDRIIHLPLSIVADPDQREPRRFSRGPVTWEGLTFRYGRDSVWGATAIMLGEVAALL